MASFDEQVQKLLELGQEHVAQAWALMEDLLVKESRAYYTKVPPEMVLVHPENRGGQGCNPRQVLTLGEHILQQGASLQEAQKSIVVELAHNKLIKDQQIAFNMALVENSQGLMPSVNGKERFLAIAGTHTVMFCKAIAQKLHITPQLASTISKDLVFQDMLHGYQFLVITEGIVNQYPGIIGLASQARNSASNISKSVTELELAMRMSSFISGSANANTLTKEQIDKIVERSTADSPTCKSYAGIIMQYIMAYGGGSQMPLIRFLSDFSIQFANDPALGSEFWHSITNTPFKKDNMCVFSRTFVEQNIMCERLSTLIETCVVAYNL